jgi:hypothetical protein
MISSGEYKYISPVIDPSVRDNKTGEAQGWTLTSAALTNQPVLQGMPALVLSESGLVGETHTREATNGMNNGNSNGDGYPDRCGAFVPTAGYTNQDWDAVQLEIKRRAQRLMDADKRLDYAAAEEAVHQGDPSLARKEWDAIQTEINRRVKQWMAGDFTGRKLDYQTALQTVMGADAFLVRRHTAAKNRILGTPGVRPIDPKLGEVDLEIQPLVQAKIAASEGRMDYWPAWRAVLNERPDLARRRQAAKGW